MLNFTSNETEMKTIPYFRHIKQARVKKICQYPVLVRMWNKRDFTSAAGGCKISHKLLEGQFCTTEYFATLH